MLEDAYKTELLIKNTNNNMIHVMLIIINHPVSLLPNVLMLITCNNSAPSLRIASIQKRCYVNLRSNSNIRTNNFTHNIILHAQRVLILLII